jgi:hypothetical protein
MGKFSATRMEDSQMPKKKGKSQSSFILLGVVVWILVFGMARVYLDANPGVLPWQVQTDMEINMVAAVIGLIGFFVAWAIYEQVTGESTDNWYDPPKF